MVVVNTLQQLEEAVRLDAEEILVTGEIADSVREVFIFKSANNIVAGPTGIFSTENAEIVERIAEKSGVPAGQIASIMIISEDYSLLDAPLASNSPCLLVHKQCRIKD